MRRKWRREFYGLLRYCYLELWFLPCLIASVGQPVSPSVSEAESQPWLAAVALTGLLDRNHKVWQCLRLLQDLEVGVLQSNSLRPCSSTLREGGREGGSVLAWHSKWDRAPGVICLEDIWQAERVCRNSVVYLSSHSLIRQINIRNRLTRFGRASCQTANRKTTWKCTVWGLKSLQPGINKPH